MSINWLSANIQQVFWTTSTSNAPLISGTMPVAESTRYNVQVELMQTDTDASNEYAVIILNGLNFGACYPGGTHRGCEYVNCSNQKNRIIGNSTMKTDSGQTSIPIAIKYSNHVSGSSYRCPINGTISPAVARITLTPIGRYLSLWITCLIWV